MIPPPSTPFLVLLSLLLLLSSVEGSEDEYRLIQDLKENYDAVERPVLNHSQALVVHLRLFPQQLLDVDEKNQVITMIVWTEFDYKLQWEPREYGGISKVQLPSASLWKPDVLLFNSADEHFDASFPVNCVVSHKGEVLFVPPGVSLDIDVTWFPFDEQLCHLKYGSWTYNGYEVDMRINDTGLEPGDTMDTSLYIQNGEWQLLGTPGKRDEILFSGSKYIELYFRMHLKRKVMYYGVNWIVPSVLITLTNVLGYTLPPECGEKITLQITNLLSVTVFLGIVSEMTPQTESIPVIAAFFSMSMLILGCSIVFTILIISIHFRSPKTHEMSAAVRTIFLEWLPWVLLMTRPGQEFRRPRRKNTLTSVDSDGLDEKGRPVRIHVEGDHCSFRREYLPLIGVEPRKPQLVESLDDIRNTHLQSSLQEIVDLLRRMSGKLEEQEEEEDLQQDWRFVAMVVDRLSLYLFTGALLATVVFLFVFTPTPRHYE